jgi:putative restriction endonuclease
VPGDLIFSFRDTRIAALGIARSYCYESPKPTEFGTAGSYWEAIGWKIDVSFREPDKRIHPKPHRRAAQPAALEVLTAARKQ